MIINRIVLLLSLIGTSFILYAQPSNVDCQNALTISDPSDFCSGNTEYTNVNAGASGFGPSNCWDSTNNDVWFKFTAVAKAASITVSGTASGGTLARPMVTMYLVPNGCTGTINEMRCNADSAGNGIASFVRGALVIGETYYLRVDGWSGDTGTFQLCISNYNPPTEPGQDCIDGAILCDKEPFTVEILSGGGSNSDEAAGTCLGQFGSQSENQSTWFKWTCKTAGSLTFILDPLKENDDLDWVLYELVEGIDMCGIKATLRCNATYGGVDFFTGIPEGCGDLTGLDLTSTDTVEDSNCDAGEDGFCQFIDMEVGKSYALLVNNWSDSGQGFDVEFGGTGEFLGPEPDFTIDPLEGLRCDTTFTITDNSSFANGNIVAWEWNFGKDALPAGDNTIGPHFVEYTSFGRKSIALTVTSEKGCLVTKVIDIDVLPCCSDTSTLMAFAEATSLVCPGDQNGVIEADQTGGAGPFQYSINDGDFNTSNAFGGLGEGNYEIQVQDQKGCLDTAYVEIIPPDQIFVDAGEDVTIPLGDSTQLDASYMPSLGNEIIEWITPDGLDCTDCLDPWAFAPGTTEYILQITDENGCIELDTVIVRTTIDNERPLFSPNIMLVDDPREGSFMLGSSRAVERILDLRVYDRWGNLVFEGTDIPRNDFARGWDGYFGGFPAQIGVYTWAANVLFIDGVEFQYSGDIMLTR